MMKKNEGIPFSQDPLIGRDGGIRTHDHLNPIQVLYQTEPHPVTNFSVEGRKVTKTARFPSMKYNLSERSE